MFTGIIEEKGTVKRIEQQGSKKYIIISCTKMQAGLQTGASIACDGICLTVVSFSGSEIKLEAMPETLKKTTLGNWFPGYPVNLERALSADSRFDGHIVQGHVDCRATVLRVVREAAAIVLEIEIPSGFLPLVADRGSIAVNGVSLTVAALSASSFKISLVSFTLEKTNLSALKPGSKVNIEFDIIGKYVIRYLHSEARLKTMEKLRDKII